MYALALLFLYKISTTGRTVAAAQVKGRGRQEIVTLGHPLQTYALQQYDLSAQQYQMHFFRRIFGAYGLAFVADEVYFSCGGRTFLIVGDKTDCSIIPEKNRSSDYLIINGNVENLQLLHCREAIISGDEENAAQLRQKLSSSCDSCCVTGGRGSICVRVRSDGSAALRREGSWLS